MYIKSNLSNYSLYGGSVLYGALQEEIQYLATHTE